MNSQTCNGGFFATGSSSTTSTTGTAITFSSTCSGAPANGGPSSKGDPFEERGDDNALTGGVPRCGNVNDAPIPNHTYGTCPHEGISFDKAVDNDGATFEDGPDRDDAPDDEGGIVPGCHRILEEFTEEERSPLEDILGGDDPDSVFDEEDEDGKYGYQAYDKRDIRDMKEGDSPDDTRKASGDDSADILYPSEFAQDLDLLLKEMVHPGSYGRDSDMGRRTRVSQEETWKERGFSIAQAMVLAVASHFATGSVPEDMRAILPRDPRDREAFRMAASSLEKSGWIEKVEGAEPFDGMIPIRLTPEGRIAVLRNLPLGTRKGQGFRELLISISSALGHPYSGLLKESGSTFGRSGESFEDATPETRQEIVSRLDLYCTSLIEDSMETEPFARGLVSLGYMEMEPGKRLTFLAVAIRFRDRYTDFFEGDEHILNTGPVSFTEYRDELLSDGLVEYCQKAAYENTETGYLLSRKAARVLFAGHTELIRKEKLHQELTIYRWQDIEEKPLFYNKEDRMAYSTIAGIASGDNCEMVLEDLKKYKLRTSLGILLYGAPGCGKTEMARQVARSSHKDLYCMSIEKNRKSYVGEEENTVADIFRNMGYMSALSGRGAILFIDEADAFFAPRVSVGRSNDVYVNSVQNILLQAIERYDGLFIAASNTTSNIDTAFDSRIAMKFEIHRPDSDTRRAILSSKASFLGEDAIETIATGYELTGRQIDNVLIQVIMLSRVRGALPSLDEIREMCQSESDSEKRAQMDSRYNFTSKDDKSRKKIGF